MLFAIYIAIDGTISVIYFNNKPYTTTLQQLARFGRMIIGLFIYMMIWNSKRC